MAKRKCTGRGKTTNARKLVLENAQSAEKREKLKDDPGGEKSNNMDERKKITSKKQKAQYKNTVKNNNLLSGTTNNNKKNHNNLQQLHKEQSAGGTLTTSNVRKQTNTSLSGTFSSTSTATTAATAEVTTAITTTTSHRSEKKNTSFTPIENSKPQNAKMTLSETSKLMSELISSNSSSTNSDSSSLSRNINNNSNYPNNQNNANKCYVSESSTMSTWNNLKYLHKKFKRIASATTNTATAHHLDNEVTAKGGSSISSTSSSSPSTSPISESPPMLIVNRSHGAPDNTNVFKEESHRVPLVTNGHVVDVYDTKNIRSIPNDNLTEKQTNSGSNKNSSSNLSNNSDLGLSNSMNNSCSSNVSGHILNSSSATTSSVVHQSNQKLVQQALSFTNTQVKPTVTFTTTITDGSTVQQQQHQQQLSKHVCPYCNLNCTKPSVLQKHIRAHTNERPYPCDTCGFAFKTKSNYYKHCRSRSHALRMGGVEPPNDADESSLGASDQEQDPDISNSSSELISRTTSPIDEWTLSQVVSQQQQQKQQTSSPSTKIFLQSNNLVNQHEQLQQQQVMQKENTQQLKQCSANYPIDTNSSIQQQEQQRNHIYSNDKPYKPKFHNAALYSPTNKIQQGIPLHNQEQGQHQQHIEEEEETSNFSKEHNQHHVLEQHHQTALQVPKAITLQQQQQKMGNTAKISSHHLTNNQQIIPMPGALTFSSHISPPSSYYINPSMLHHYYTSAATAQHSLLPIPGNQREVMSSSMSPAHYSQQQQYHQQHSNIMTSSLQSSISPSNNTPTHLNYKPSHANVVVSGAARRISNSPSMIPISSEKDAHTAASGNTNSSILTHKVSNTNAPGSGHQLNVERLQEHISKLISQNEAIVENKELLLQKKYPKTLNRSRSFTSANTPSPASTSIQTSTTVLSGESTSTKLAQAIAHKQQLQQQQQMQQHLQQQQQLQQQYLRGFSEDPTHTVATNSQNNPSTSLSKNLQKPASVSVMHTVPQQLQHNSHQQQQYLYQQQEKQTQQQKQQQQQQQKQQHLNQQQQQQYQHQHPQNQHQLLNQKSNLQQQQQQQHQSQQRLSIPVSPSIQSQMYPSTQKDTSLVTTINVPLNLSKIVDLADTPSTSSFSRKRLSVETRSSPVPENAVTSTTGRGKSPALHPQNPSNSIIKNLLLNARGLAVPTGEGDDAVYICPLCSLEFRTAEDLQVHNSTYCQGTPSSAPTSPISSPSTKFFRSNSINVSLPELNNPNSLAKLAKSSFYSKNPLSLVKLAWSQLKTKPSNLVLDKLSSSSSVAVTSASIAATASEASCSNAIPVSSSASEGSTSTPEPFQEVFINNRFMDTPLPSPGPLLGKTPLVESYNHNDKKSEGIIIRKVHEDQNQPSFRSTAKKLKIDKNLQPEFSTHVQQSTQSNKLKSNVSYSVAATEIALDKKENRSKRFMSSGGCMVPISECPDLDMSPKMIRTPLLSGGSFQEVSPKVREQPSNRGPTPKIMIPITPLTPSHPPSLQMTGPTHFQFPPINSITAFNPLTLPILQQSGDEKMIPYVPGIPGPNCLTPQLPPPQQLQVLNQSKNPSPSRQKLLSPAILPGMLDASAISPKSKTLLVESEQKKLSPFGGVNNVPSEFSRVPPSPALRSNRWINPNQLNLDVPKKSFNFLRMADNISPKKSLIKYQESEKEVRHFNFENLPRETEIIPPTQSSHDPMTPLHVDTSNSTFCRSAETIDSGIESFEEKTSPSKHSKFLRPTSLPLKPGTFTPKRHHGITPNANTLPLISPETPRQSKACAQMYLNGHAYTYLGLKCSTKMFYCTVNCPQPSYVANLHKLSMYSVWQVCAENNPHPMGFKPKTVMALYDARQKSCANTKAGGMTNCKTVQSQLTVMTPFENSMGQFYHHQLKPLPFPPSGDCSSKNPESNADNDAPNNQQLLVGGYESHENYTYIRGRGRGRFVCLECGIRCKKPSMLKKHIRTHTDVRPYTCKHCNFSFKTKGNLTKHMQSKTHFKKCIDLGINPGPMPADGVFMEPDFEYDHHSINSGGGRSSSLPGESSDDDFSDNETESSDADDSKSRLQEHEAARCLLSLSMTPPISGISPNDSYTYQNEIQTPPKQNQQQAQQQQRRVVSFTSPKPPFDYQKQEQYYSNPEESKPKLPQSSIGENTILPIDLTKPRSSETLGEFKVIKPVVTLSQMPHQTIAQIRDVIGNVSNESMFLKSLIHMTDRVRSSIDCSATRIDSSALHKAYLTEQALHYRKIKQSQMNRNSIDGTSESNNIYTNNSSSSRYLNVTATTLTNSTLVISSIVSQMKPTFQILEEPTRAKESDSATKQEKVHSTKLEQVGVPLKDTLSVKIKASENAKSVASEYLKMTKSKSCSSKPSEESGDESTSDYETVGADNSSPSTLAPLSSSSNNGSSTNTDFSSVPTRTVIVGEDGFKSSTNEIQPVFPRVPISTDGRPVCTICSKTFQKQHQLVLHMNIHYMERKFKCEPCGISFRTQGHLQKHERSEGHRTKITMTSTFGVPTSSNPRPFECTDCKIAFRIHGHLAKHLRSKTHVQKLECLTKLPFGTYAEIERSGISLSEIDTSDCDNSLISLKVLAQKLMDKDPTTMGNYTSPSGMHESNNLLNQTNGGDSGSEDGYDIHSIDDGGKTEDTSTQNNVDNDSLKKRIRPFSRSDEEVLDGVAPEKRQRTQSEFSTN